MTSCGHLLVCSDLDGTLIPNGPEPESPGAREHFTRLVSCPQVELAYVSGRSRDQVEQAVEDNHLPVPDFVIGDVGTTIYHVGSARDWSYQVYWEEVIGRDWGDRSHAELTAMLDDLPALRLQESGRQNVFKLSYYVSRPDGQQALADAIQHRLRAHGVRARLVWSVDRPDGTVLLDIVPRSASKLHAIEGLMRRRGYRLHNTVFSGDSGNDLDVFASPVPSVVVANAPPEIKQQARAMAVRSGNAAQLYVACGGYPGMNGNYCAGLLEGIAHYCPRALEWMGFQPAGWSHAAG